MLLAHRTKASQGRYAGTVGKLCRNCTAVRRGQETKISAVVPTSDNGAESYKNNPCKRPKLSATGPQCSLNRERTCGLWAFMYRQERLCVDQIPVRL